MSLGPGAIILGMLLAAGAVFGLIAVAANQPEVVDSMGNTPSAAINTTQGAITNTTAPLAGLGGGALLFLAALLVLGVAVVIWRASQGPAHSRRG